METQVSPVSQGGSHHGPGPERDRTGLEGAVWSPRSGRQFLGQWASSVRGGFLAASPASITETQVFFYLQTSPWTAQLTLGGTFSVSVPLSWFQRHKFLVISAECLTCRLDRPCVREGGRRHPHRMRSFPLVGGRGSGQVGKGFFLFALGPGLLLSVLVWGSFLIIMVKWQGWDYKLIHINSWIYFAISVSPLYWMKCILPLIWYIW